MEDMKTKIILRKTLKFATVVSVFGLVIIAASYYAPNAKAIDMIASGSCGYGSFHRLDGGPLSNSYLYVCKGNGTSWRFYRLAQIKNSASNIIFDYSNGYLKNQSNDRTLNIGGSECSNADGLWIFGQEGATSPGSGYVNYQNSIWNWQQVPGGWGFTTPLIANRSRGYDIIYEWQHNRVSLPSAMTNKIVTSKDAFAEQVSSHWDDIDGTLITWEGAKELFDVAVQQGRYDANKWNTGLEWNNGGSGAGLAGFCVNTEGLKSTHFDGKTEVYNNTTYVANGGSIEVRANSTDKIKFKHSLSRRNEGPSGNKTAKYYVNASVNDDSFGSTSSLKTKSLAKNSGWQLVRERITDKGDKITLAPGQEKIRWQTIHYTDTEKATTANATPNTRCTITGYVANGRYCVKVWRPVANFSGSVSAKIQDGSGNATNAPSDSSTRATTITDPNGAFTIQFQHTVKRESDNAGGTASTPWSTVITVNSTTQTAKNANGTSNALRVGETHKVKTYSGYTYSGNLRYGETIVICSKLTYAKVVNNKDGNTNDTKTKCVKVYREKAKCGINNGYRYGIHDGRNIGRIGVVNRTIAGSDSYSYTNYTPSSFTASNGYTNTVSVWARPGDSIRFKYEACAGASYAVYNTSTLSNNTYKTTYAAAGSSNGHADAGAPRFGYLFGETVPTLTQASNPRIYSDSRTWNSYTATSGFLHNSSVNGNAELNTSSPSPSSSSTYNKDTYNKKFYECYPLPNGASYVDEHYQIAGRSNSANCKSSNNMRNYGNDVGSTITQSLSWNDLKILNSAVSGTTRTLKSNAKVHIPYNYILKPYAERDTSPTTNVVYGGSDFTVKTGVFIQPRTNTSISDQAATNKYATISKPTRVKIERYFTTYDGSGDISDTETSLTTISDTSNVIFNATGDLKGNTSGNGEVYPNSTGVSVHVPDDRPVGSLVCLKFSVWPRDSHNNLSATSGAGDKNVALTGSAEVSGGTNASWAIARACYTVAKRPTTSFEGSNALAAGTDGFVTSRYTRMFSPGSTKFYFGSWSEYALIGRNNVSGVHGTASGATFGYKVGTPDVTINATRANNDASTSATAANSNDICVFGSQMIPNDHTCDTTGVLGEQIASAANSAKNFAATIRSRYTAETPTKVVNTGSLGTCNNVTAPGNAKCVKIDNGTKYARINSSNGVIATATGGDTIYNKINGNAYIDSALVAPKQTTIYEVSGTLVIGGDILTANSGSDPTYTHSVKQNLIFANNILILPNVTKIDALVVSENLVDTCAYESTAKWNTDTRITLSNLSSDICTSQLVFEAPVITKTINLYRTYGAASDTSSVRRGEIFNFNMANYLWDYGQASKYSQANTTYIRELPPRY